MIDNLQKATFNTGDVRAGAPQRVLVVGRFLGSVLNSVRAAAGHVIASPGRAMVMGCGHPEPLIDLVHMFWK